MEAFVRRGVTNTPERLSGCSEGEIQQKYIPARQTRRGCGAGRRLRDWGENSGAGAGGTCTAGSTPSLMVPGTPETASTRWICSDQRAITQTSNMQHFICCSKINKIFFRFTVFSFNVVQFCSGAAEPKMSTRLLSCTFIS